MGHKPCVGAHARRHKCTAHRCGSGGVTATGLRGAPAQDESRQEALKVDHNHVQTPHQAIMYRKLTGNIYIYNYICVCVGGSSALKNNEKHVELRQDAARIA